MTAVNELEDRVAKLEQHRYGCPEGIEVDDPMRRVRIEVEQKGLVSAAWKWVPAAYYDWTLQERAKCLQAPSTDNLCKSLLLENKQSDNSDDLTNPKFVLVVIQYEATLDTSKLASAIRSLRPNIMDRLDYNQFDFRVASSEDNDRLTGFKFNSVTPFGLLDKKVPIVLSEAVVPLHFFWMGGGHVHLKLGLAVSEFVAATKGMVADISQPRNGA